MGMRLDTSKAIELASTAVDRDLSRLTPSTI